MLRSPDWGVWATAATAVSTRAIARNRTRGRVIGRSTQTVLQMTYSEPAMPVSVEKPRPTLSVSTALLIAAFSSLAVYCTLWSLHTIDASSGSIASNLSVSEYRDMLAGVAGFPYQWRLLGSYLVFAGERLTGFAPHQIDPVVKTLLLFVSTCVLYLFSRWYTSEGGGYGVIGFYLLLTVVGFIGEQYRIYFTNDYVMVACWFSAVYLIRAERYMAAALLTFVGAWAKETMMLVPILLAFESHRAPRARVALVAAVIAFAIPTAVLRSLYPAPFVNWAWWSMVFVNVPFLQRSLYEFSLTFKNNIKVALFYNVFWILAARRVFTIREPFARHLAATGVAYLFLAYPVIYIRELRHFLPLAIIVLPLAINAIEQRGLEAASARQSR